MAWKAQRCSAISLITGVKPYWILIRSQKGTFDVVCARCSRQDSVKLEGSGGHVCDQTLIEAVYPLKVLLTTVTFASPLLCYKV